MSEKGSVLLRQFGDEGMVQFLVGETQFASDETGGGHVGQLQDVIKVLYRGKILRYGDSVEWHDKVEFFGGATEEKDLVEEPKVTHSQLDLISRFLDDPSDFTVQKQFAMLKVERRDIGILFDQISLQFDEFFSVSSRLIDFIQNLFQHELSGIDLSSLLSDDGTVMRVSSAR